MFSLSHVKAAIVGAFVLGVILWATSGSFSQSKQPQQSKSSTPNQSEPFLPAQEKYDPDQYAGSETCQACHEDQFKYFSKTAHSHLVNVSSWKGKVVGCESCHGPGKAHVESGGDKSLIRSFKNMGAKLSSETCLSCHAGKEEHNSFRRGEHWRNNVGCTDCHYSHQPDPSPPPPESMTLIADNVRRRIDSSALRMLKDNEVSLCLTCHAEQKVQFTLPFHHKVLEGLIKCSDCHNPHGGFETRLLRLTTGPDAACVKCHTNKQGPFVFEHAPVRVEGCAICHIPHGSSNPKLLTRSHVFQLCIECHTNTGAVPEEGAPGVPSFHDLTTERIRNCVTCHTAIHGSNTHNFFFR
jgi:predicted CXXCH cytochrome family protein